MLQLSEALQQAGLTKNKLADIMGVSRQTIYRMGELMSDKVAQALDDYAKTHISHTIMPNDQVLGCAPCVHDVAPTARKEPDDYTDDDIRVLLKRRGAGESDYDIAHSVGLKVHEFNAIIHAHAVAGCKSRLGRCWAA